MERGYNISTLSVPTISASQKVSYELGRLAGKKFGQLLKTRPEIIHSAAFMSLKEFLKKNQVSLELLIQANSSCPICLKPFATPKDARKHVHKFHSPSKPSS